MSLSIGIVGLPNVGKSTLFKTLTKKEVDIANYPFCTIDPNIGVVLVPDERVDKLTALTSSAKKIYTTVEFVDIAGLVKGASEGEGLGNKFLTNIRETDAVLYILRAFLNSDIINTQGSINPIRDKEILDIELLLKDLETVAKRIQSLEGDVRAKKKEAIKELEVLNKAKDFLSREKILAEQSFTPDEEKILSNYQLLTLKPRLYLLNGNKGEIDSASKNTLEIFNKNKWPYLIMDIAMELETADLPKDERISFGLSAESEVDVLIKESYKLLNLITFFTTGADETRAWTIKNGSKAPQAGGVIHSDFEKNFIRADVINWKDLIASGGFTQSREKGLIRTEGKEYFIQDGDVIEIKHG